MATEEQLKVTITTVADTRGAQQVNQALRQVQQTAAQEGPSQKILDAAARASEFQRRGGMAAALGGTPASVQKHAQATRQLGESFHVTGNEIGRMALALFGVSAGLNVFTTVGELANRTLANLVQGQIDLSYAARGTAAAYGQQQATQLEQAARAFQAAPGTTGSAAQFLQSATALNQFATSAGISVEQTQQLIGAAGRLAQLHHTDLAPALAAVVGAVHGNTEALADYGVVLTDSSGRIKGLNATYGELVDAVGKAKAEQLLAKVVINDTGEEAKNAAPKVHDLADAMDRLGKVGQGAQTGAGEAVKGPLTDFLTTLATILEGKGNLSAIDPTMGVATSRWEDHVQAAKDAAAADKAVAGATDNATAAITRQLPQLDVQLNAYQQLSIGLRHYLEVLSRLQTEQGQQGTLERALAGTAFAQAGAGQIQAVAQAQAAQDVIGQRAQRVAMQQVDTFRQQLELQVETSREIGPNAVAVAEAQLAAYDKLVDAHRQIIQAQNVQQDLQYQGVQLSAQEADIRLRMLPAQQQMAALQRDITEQQLRARQAAVPATEVAEDLRYVQQRATLIATNPYATPEERAAARGQLRGLVRAQPGVELT